MPKIDRNFKKLVAIKYWQIREEVPKINCNKILPKNRHEFQKVSLNKIVQKKRQKFQKIRFQ